MVAGRGGGKGGRGEALMISNLTLLLAVFRVTAQHKLQALVYDILPSTSATVEYAAGLENLSANAQFFDDAQMLLSA